MFAIGMKGADVLKLQKEINAANKGKAGYVPLDEDGKYGPLTDAAYKAYTAPKVETPADVSGLSGVKGYASPVTASASPILDSNGNAYVITPGGFSTVGKGANGSYMLGEGERYATADEVGKITPMISGVMSGTPITDLSGLSNFNMSGNASADTGGYTDPFADKINALLDKFLNYDPNAYIDPTTLPQYGALKSEYDKAGQSAFNNQIGRLAALTGGRPSTAAVGTATGAQNEYAQEFASNVVPGLINQERANRQNTMNNILGQLRELQGLSNTAYERNMTARNDERQEYIDTIGQFANDFTAEINRVTNDNDPSNDWQIGYLKTERQKKLQAMAEQKAAEAAAASKAEQDAWKNAMEMWKTSGVVTSQKQADILGVKVGAKTADYNIASINANTARINANKSSSKDEGSTLTNTQIFNQAKNMLNAQVPTGEINADDKPIYRPKYTREQFENWLAKMFPMTPEGDKAYDDIVAALDLDNVEFYVPGQEPRQNIPAYLVNR